MDIDFDLPSEASSSGESFLSKDEEDLLGSFDAEIDAAAQPEGSGMSQLPSIDDIPGIDESLLDEAPQAKLDDIEELGSSTIDIRLEDIESSREVPSFRPDAVIDMDSVEGLSAPSTVIEDVSAEFIDLGAPASSAPESVDVTADFLAGDELPSLDSSAAAEATADVEQSSEFENIDMDLHFDDTIPHADSEAQAGSAPLPGFESVTEFDDFLSSDQKAAEPVADQAFDDVAAVENELADAPLDVPEVAQARPAAPAAPASASSDLSNEILLKIAQELSSIRGELVSLKTQLGDLRREAESDVVPDAARAADKDEEEESAGGFFDEEEDETIALTGDELDNILNTADFTEEVGTDGDSESLETPEATEELPDFEEPVQEAAPEPLDTSIIDESILPESGDYSAAPADLPAIEEVSLGDASTEETGFEEIGLISEDGVAPMTEAPEDTSYLETESGFPESETLTIEELDNVASSAEQTIEEGLGDISLNDVPLVEPDLSEFDAEDFGAEPIAEISEELPLVEEAEVPDLAFSVDEVPEAETFEATEEVDSSDFSGIDLHEENLSASIPEFEEIAVEEPLEEALERSTIKPAEPVAIHPDELPDSLDDTLFVEESAPEQLAAEEPALQEATTEPAAQAEAAAEAPLEDNDRLKSEIRSVLSYLDKLLDSLPEDKIEEFARSEHFDTYKKLFEELGLV